MRQLKATEICCCEVMNTFMSLPTGEILFIGENLVKVNVRKLSERNDKRRLVYATCGFYGCLDVNIPEVLE